MENRSKGKFKVAGGVNGFYFLDSYVRKSLEGKLVAFKLDFSITRNQLTIARLKLMHRRSGQKTALSKQ